MSGRASAASFKETGKPGQPLYGTTCGRRTCSKCRRFRHACDFGVREWSDYRQLRPARLRRECNCCKRVIERTRKRIRDEACKPPPVVKPVEVKRPPAPDPTLSRVEFFGVMLEGAAPIIQLNGISLADEDYDLTPVPTGCASCWRTGGVVCYSCPNADAQQQRRFEIKQGLVSPV